MLGSGLLRYHSTCTRQWTDPSGRGVLILIMYGLCTCPSVTCLLPAPRLRTPPLESLGPPRHCVLLPVSLVLLLHHLLLPHSSSALQRQRGISTLPSFSSPGPGLLLFFSRCFYGPGTESCMARALASKSSECTFQKPDLF